MKFAGVLSKVNKTGRQAGEIRLDGAKDLTIVRFISTNWSGKAT